MLQEKFPSVQGVDTQFVSGILSRMVYPRQANAKSAVNIADINFLVIAINGYCFIIARRITQLSDEENKPTY